MISPDGPNTNRRSATRAGGRSRLLLPVFLLLGAALAWSWILRVPSGEDDVRTVFVPVPPPPQTLADTLRRGQTLGEVFSAYGLGGLEIARIVDAIREYQSPRRLRPGTVFHFATRGERSLERISLELDPDRRLYLFRGASGDGWDARLDSVPVVRDTILIGGLVGSNLYDAELWGDTERLGPGQHEDLVFRLSEVYAWQIDFYRDIRTGDQFRAGVERDVRPDGSVRELRILAAEFDNSGREITAIRFQPMEGKRIEYFDREGEALRSQFLRSPLPFGRVTSRFSYRRYHPILKRRRPHLGTDYGAPVGTPVRATGAGKVSRAGWWGGYGRVVEVRHTNGLRTRYAHLSRIAKGVLAGGRVEQGQTIGFVGSSGLSTGAHVHYEFLRNGRHVNPSRLDLPKAAPVSETDRARFLVERDAAVDLLDRLRLRGSRIAERGRTVRVGDSDIDADRDR